MSEETKCPICQTDLIEWFWFESTEYRCTNCHKTFALQEVVKAE